MGVFSVSTAAEFMAIIKIAKSGDTIQLNSGTYGPISLLNVKFDGGITITSANSAAHAELTGLKMTGVSGLTFTNLTLTDKDASTSYDFAVQDSANVHFDKVLIQGSETGTTLTDNPFMIRGSSNVSVTNSEVTHVRYGISMLDNNGITLSNNYFHDIRTDGIRGGGNSNIAISDNFFTNFDPAGTDHPDAIQFWTTNTHASAENITITDNVIVRGDGSAIQGIFMGDEAGYAYRNVLIDGNTVIGAMYNGISVAHAEGLTVTDNTVIGSPDQKSWIRVNDVDVLSGNTAEAYIVDGVNVYVPVNNQVVAPVLDGGMAFLTSHLSSILPELGLLGGNHLAAIVAAAPPAPVTPTVTTLNGTDGADKLKAGLFGDYALHGGAGNDTLTGGPGHTTMDGGLGNDIYNVNSDRDIVVENVSGGDDTVYTTVNYTLTDNVETLRLAASDLTVHGNALDNRIVGTAGADTMYGGGGNDSLQGLGGSNVLHGEAGNDTLSAAEGNDHLFGEDGNDNLTGGAGTDVLDGGAGNDLLEGGVGADILTGGLGADTFNYRPADISGRDTITDFSTAQGDKITLSLIDANSNTTKNDAFTFIGDSAFTHVAGQLHYVHDGSNIVVQGDLNGDGVADFSILLQGVTHIAGSDFAL